MLVNRWDNSKPQPRLADILVELVDECGLYHFGLLGCSSSPNGGGLGITCDSDFGAIGIDCAGTVALRTAVDSNAASCDRRRRSDIHCCRGVLSGLREDREVSCFAGAICRSGESGPGRWGVGETTHDGRKGEARGRLKWATTTVTATADEPTIVAGVYSFDEENEVRNGAEGVDEKANRTRSIWPLETRSWREKRAIGKAREGQRGADQHRSSDTWSIIAPAN